MWFKIIALEERIVLDAAVGDAVAQTTESASYTAEVLPEFNGEISAALPVEMIPVDFESLNYDPTGLPLLESNPGAGVTLHLDFDGIDLTGSPWNVQFSSGPISIGAFDLDSNATTFIQSEAEAIYDIWAYAAEDFAPFDINVTTIDPGHTNQNEALKIVISDDTKAFSAGGGIAFMDTFSSSSSNDYRIGFSYQLDTYNASLHGTAVSHEAGHILGLIHNSEYNDSTGGLSQEYHYGFSDVGFVMGEPYNGDPSLRSIWTTSNFDNYQAPSDELEFILKPENQIDLRPDDHGGDLLSATSLAIANDQFSGLGVVGYEDDGAGGYRYESDYFELNLTAGMLSLDVNGAPGIFDRGGAANLNVALELYNDQGTLIATANDGASIDAHLEHEILNPGLYYLRVTSGDQNLATGEAIQIDNNTGEVVASPAPGQYVNALIGGGGQFTIAGSILPINAPPVAADDNVITSEDAALIIDVLANDNDSDGDPLTVMLIGQPANGFAVVNPDNTITYTPNPNFNGPDNFTYEISDPLGETSQATVNIDVQPVDDAPYIDVDNVDSNNPVPENDEVTIQPSSSATLLGKIAAGYSGPLEELGDLSQLANDLGINNPDNVLVVGDPDYTMIPVGPDTSLSSFQIINNNPQLGDTLNIIEDTLLKLHQGNTISDIIIAAGQVAFLNSVSDSEDLLYVKVTIADTLGVNGEVIYDVGFVDSRDNSSTTLPIIFSSDILSRLYFDTQDPSGFRTLEVRAIDDTGLSSELNTITIDYPNNPPVAADDNVITSEDAALIIDVLANDNDSDGDPLTVLLLGQPAHGQAVLNPDNTVTYTPDLNYNGLDSFQYSIDDGNGGMASANVNIDVLPVNDDPVASDDMAMTDEDIPLIINVADLLANDSDVDGDLLTFSGFDQPSHGQLIDNGDGTLTYSPEADYNGPDSFQYNIDDGNGGMASANVNIDVLPVNDPPVASDDALVLDEDTSASLNLLANDYDIDGDPLAVSILSGPANGQISLDAMGNLTYTPNANYNGPDTVTYEISDGEFTAQAQLAITVNPVNDPPVASDDQLTVGVGLAGMGNVLDNDTDVDLPNDQLHVELVQGPEHGSLILNADGTFQYEHDASLNFADTFTYRVIDAEGASDEAVVHITVEEQSDGPNLKLPGFEKKIYIENHGAKVLAPAVFLRDSDSKDFDGGKLRVELAENGTLNDMLLIKEHRRLQVDEMGQIFFRGELIGIVEGGQNGEALIVTFNQNANTWDVARVISRVAYQNDSDNPDTAIRDISFTVTDGDGGISNEAMRQIWFFDVNDDPEIIADSDSVNASAGDLINIGEELGVQITDADLDEDGMAEVKLKVRKGLLNFTDVEDLDTVIFSDELDADGLRRITFMANLEEANILLSRLTYQSREGFTGTDYLWIKVSDLGGDGILGGNGEDWEKFEIYVC